MPLANLPESIAKRLFTIACIAVFVLVFSFQRRLLKRYNKDLQAIRTADDKVVTKALVGNLRHMAGIALPKWNSREGITTMGFVGLFLLRSVLYVMGSHADGKIMELILAAAKGHASRFRVAKAVSFFAGIQLMQAATGGLIEHVRHHLIASYRKILTHHFHQKFFDKLTYYHATAIDSRLEAADTVIPVYCEEFAEHFAELPYYFVMPFFDASVSLLEVIRQVGSRPAAGLVCVAGIFLAALRAFTPPFGRIHALLLQREEEFKKKHTDVQNAVEQIAFLNGGEVSKERANYTYKVLMRSLEQMAAAKGFFKLLEDAVGGCCWELVGFLVSWSVVQSRIRNGGGRKVGGSLSGAGGDKLLSSMVVQRRLVTDFHVAVTAIVVNFKEVSHLSEFTEKLAEFDKTLDSIARGEFARFVGAQHSSEGGGAMDISPGANLESTANFATSTTMDGFVSVGGDIAATIITSDSANNPSASRSNNPPVVLRGSSAGNPNAVATAKELNASFTRNGSFTAAATTASDTAITGRAVGGAHDDEEVAKQWDIPELAEDGWVPCVMSPALHRAVYTSTTTHAVLADHCSLSLNTQNRIVSPSDITPTKKKQDPTTTDGDEQPVATITSGAASPAATAPSAVDASPISPIGGGGLSAATNTTNTTTAANHAPLVEFKRTDICTPNGKLLIKALDLVWEQGQSWAISGPNGCGKSSLLRVLARTWLHSAGEVGIHPKVKFIYVPQTPYFPPDTTLAEQVMYPLVPTLVKFEIIDSPSADGTASRVRKAVAVRSDNNNNVSGAATTTTSASSPSSSFARPTTSLCASSEEHDWMVCPRQQRRMKEALLLATGRQLLAEVIRGWESPTAGLYNPHQKFVQEHHNGNSSNGTTPAHTPTVSASHHHHHSNSDDVSSSSSSNATTALYTEGTFSGCDRNLSWPSLSGGQQQKLSLSRAFYQSLLAIEEGFIPIVVMDESTSQMDEASEEAVFKNLNARKIAMLSVSHRKEVVLRHTHILQLARDPSKWRLVEVNEHTVNDALEI